MNDVSSQDLVKDLVKKIDAFNKNQIKYIEVGQDDTQQIFNEKNVKIALKKLYRKSIKDNFYFFDCPLDVYKDTFDTRFTEFKKINIDADKVDFMKSEFKKLYQANSNRIMETVNYHAFSTGIESFNISIKKKRDYLKKELKKKRVYILNEPLENVSPYEDVPLDDEVRFGERDITGVLTSNQVVILLDNAGFFVNANIEDKTQGEKAELISMITGYNVKNVITNIGRLELKPSEISKNYQKDLDFIDSILNNK
jgi:hypothetical protein